jgi:hypothetical protein
MPRLTHKQAWLDLVVGALVFYLLGGCDRAQTVSLVTEDFRFVPDVVRVRSSSPLTLSVYNAGREIHEFDSPILLYATATPVAKTAAGPRESPSLLLPPGQSLQILMTPAPGTYLYICRRKGHANMTGTLVVE